MPSIEAVNLGKHYGSFVAVSNLNLKVDGAKCVGFLGPNGAGKTTTLKMLTDLIKPTSGEALINGVNVNTKKKQALESVGTLIETPEIYSSLTAKKALKMIAELRGINNADCSGRIDDVLAEVQMENWENKRVSKFSKGMKQRICIAATLLSDPCVILLDEPTSGLDPRGMSEVRSIIKSLKNKKRLIFMSSHLLSEVADVCDEVAMIDQGKLVVYDSISKVTEKVSDGENFVEVGLRNTISDELMNKIKLIPGVIAAHKKDDLSIEIKFTGNLDAQGQILRNIVRMNIVVVSYKPASSALEEAYLRLIKSRL
jgi:ABC-2 type transport system ATP-binding protein